MSATDLRHALIDALNSDVYSPSLIVTTDDPIWLNEDVLTGVTGVGFLATEAPLGGARTGEQLMLMSLHVPFYTLLEDQDELELEVFRLTEAFLQQSHVSIFAMEYTDDHIGAPPYLLSLLLEPSIIGKSVAALHEVGLGMIALIESVEEGGLLDRTAALHVLRARRAEALIGQPEGPWLDVKEKLYDLASLHGKISLAQAVARFANSTDGGLLIFGMATRKVGSGEVLGRITPVVVDGYSVRRHRQALEKHLYPFPTGLSVSIVATAAGGKLLIIELPPQPDTSKPYLVHGAIVDGKVRGSFVSVVRRSGEDSIPIEAPALHALMSANRLIDVLRAHVGPYEPSSPVA
ncbi:AlbA family DNA-binding domain-containing protein [Nakamurella endophytica]|nr:hypothetical protein [Nakamurella endophytica]